MVVVMQTSGCVFVKELDYFISQDGLIQDWGINWKPIVATSVEEARRYGCEMPGAKPYCKQMGFNR